MLPLFSIMTVGITPQPPTRRPCELVAVGRAGRRREVEDRGVLHGVAGHIGHATHLRNAVPEVHRRQELQSDGRGHAARLVAEVMEGGGLPCVDLRTGNKRKLNFTREINGLYTWK